MSFAQFISILRARQLIAWSVLALTVLVTIAVTAFLPKQYTATGTVVVDTKTDPIAGATMQGVTPTFIATQVDVLLSDRVALRVVRDTKMDQVPAVRQQWLADTKGAAPIEVWLSETFQKRLTVKPSRDSNVISVSYQATDPKFAAFVANAFVNAYLATVLELRVDPAKQYSAFFDERAKEARSALEEAQTKLSAYQKQTGIIASDERLDVESSRLAELSSQLVQVQGVATDSSSRNAQVTSGANDRLPEVLSSPLVSSLKTDLARNQAKLEELSARLGDKHPSVIELKANIADTQAKLAEEIKRVTGSIGVSDAVNKQREADLRGALESQRGKVMQMKAARDDQSVLLKDVENAQHAYDTISSRLTQSSLESQSNQSNIAVLTVAESPITYSSPRWELNVFLAFIIGLLLGTGAALGVEMLNRRLRSHEDVAMFLGVPVVGVVPKPVLKRRWGQRLSGPGGAQQRFLPGLTSSPPRN